MQLTQEQTQAKDRLLQFVFDDTKKQIILQGHAGTGKSALLTELIKEYNALIGDNNPFGFTKRDWVFCATTNKACEALAEKGIKASTIHSTFRLNIKDEPIGTAKIPIDAIVVIDECSYLNYPQFEYINDFPNIKIIYVGDKNQLTPVGLNHSPVFFNGIETVSLSQTMRQQNAKGVNEYVTKLREAVEHNLDTPSIPNAENIIHLSQDDFEKQILNDFSHYNLDSKILGLKNTTVQRYNKLVAKDLQVGDYLINNSYSQSMGIPNNHTVRIDNIFSEKTVLGTKVTHCRICTFGFGYYDVYIPKSARGMSIAYNKAKETNDWNTYRKFIDLRQPYAQTIHKAQGSTYENVYIHLDDLKQIETKKERNRLLYVAFSRATDKVYVTGELP